MNDQLFRIVLLLAAAFNLYGMLVFLYPDSIGTITHYPPTGSVFYSWLMAMFVGMFGVAYAWLSFQPRISRSLILLAALCKILTFIISLVCWLGGLIHVQSLGPSIFDLMFSALFVWWLATNRN